jgi:ketosteroid isomerase-like protein
MSRENVEIVRRGYEAMRREGFEAVIPFLDPDIEWHTPDQDVQANEPYRGHDGAREFWKLLNEEFESVEVEPEEILDGGDCVLVLTRTRARGRASGLTVEIADANLWTHSPQGRATSLRMFLNRDEARRAAGLQE